MTTTLKLTPVIQLSDDQFYRLCRANSDLRLELTATGELIMNPPTGGDTGRYNADLVGEFYIWNKQYQLGILFDSSTAFKLPNGATRSPDVSWILTERWNQLTPQQQQRFAPIVPDFVLELMSPSDTLKDIQDKMKEYMENGVRLGWLINRKDGLIEIYRQGKETEVVKMPTYLSGEDVLPEFNLKL